MMRMRAAASTNKRLRRLAVTRTLNMGLPHLVQEVCALGHHSQVDRKSGQNDDLLAVQRLIADGARLEAFGVSFYPDRGQPALRSDHAGGGKYNALAFHGRLQQDGDGLADAEIGRGLFNAEAERCRLLFERQPHSDELQRQRLATAEHGRSLAEVREDMRIVRYCLDPKTPRVDDLE